MKGRKSGNIINIASVAPFLGRGNVDYISTKSALLGLTRSLARQYGPFGIRANAISPGFHDTDMLKRSFQVSGVNPEEFRISRCARSPPAWPPISSTAS
jgi:NAD(P)-dependent dehydrogenase (short-subunit alcohol dehydrogenase family)